MSSRFGSQGRPDRRRDGHSRAEQRNADAEKADIKAGKIPNEWKDKGAKLRQKDRDARWKVKFSKVKAAENGKAQ